MSLPVWLLWRLPEGDRESESYRGRDEIDVLDITASSAFAPPPSQNNQGHGRDDVGWQLPW